MYACSLGTKQEINRKIELWAVAAVLVWCWVSDVGSPNISTVCIEICPLNLVDKIIHCEEVEQIILYQFIHHVVRGAEVTSYGCCYSLSHRDLWRNFVE